MIRHGLLVLSVAGVMVYAWKDWYRALCILVVMLAVLERPDMPKTILGIPGLNPFNLALVVVICAWIVSAMRGRSGSRVPVPVLLVLSAYVVVMVVAFARMLGDHDGFAIVEAVRKQRMTQRLLVTEYLVNTIKWMLPGVLIMFGAESKSQKRFAVYCLMAMYLLLAAQVLRQMPISYVMDVEALEQRALRVLERRTGYHRVDLAMILAGAVWAPLAARSLFSSTTAKIFLTGASGVLFAGLIMTGGRTGYVSWAAAGLILCILRWRHYLLLLPLALTLALGFMPGVKERMLQGIDTSTALSGGSGLQMEGVDTDTVTSGRTKVWPYVFEKIRDSPAFGFGRLAHLRTGVAVDVYRDTGELFGHPHNAYLQHALDTGLVGLGVALLFFAMIVRRAVSLFVDRKDPLASAIGGMGLGLMLAFLFAGIGSQSFYPTIGTTGMWCAMALCVRMYADRRTERRVEAMQATSVTQSPASAPQSAAAETLPVRQPAALWPGGGRPGVPGRFRSGQSPPMRSRPRG